MLTLTESNLRRIIREELEIPTFIAVERSPIHGVGIFAQQEIPAKTNIGAAQIKKPDGSYSITGLGKYHNHSDSPTCYNELRSGTRYLISRRDLNPGEEITIDYRLQPGLEQPKSNWTPT